MVLGQKRVIELRGVLVFSEEERKALDLQVHFIVRQIPRGGITRNLRIYPNRSFFGWATVLNGISVIEDVELLFFNQILYSWQRNVEQSAGVDMLNFDTILSALQTLSIQITPPTGIISKLPTVPVPYIFCPASMMHFEIVPGAIVEVQTHYIPLNESASIFVQELDNTKPPGGDDGSKNPPLNEPPLGAPPNSRRADDTSSNAPFVISPPYDGSDDGGRTYQPPFIPPWDGADGQDSSKKYTVTLRKKEFDAYGNDLNQTQIVIRTGVPGKIQGLGTKQPNNPDGTYGILTSGVPAGVLGLTSNYYVKIAWPYPNFTAYSVYTIVSVALE